MSRDVSRHRAPGPQVARVIACIQELKGVNVSESGI